MDADSRPSKPPILYSLLNYAAHPPEPQGREDVLLLRTATRVELAPDEPYAIHMALRLGLPPGCVGKVSLLPSWAIEGVRLLDPLIVGGCDDAVELILPVVWSPLATSGDAELAVPPGCPLALLVLMATHCPTHAPIAALSPPSCYTSREATQGAPEGAVPPPPPKPWWHRRRWLFPGFGFGRSR